jgi:hypothetical protein
MSKPDNEKNFGTVAVKSTAEAVGTTAGAIGGIWLAAALSLAFPPAAILLVVGGVAGQAAAKKLCDLDKGPR